MNPSMVRTLRFWVSRGFLFVFVLGFWAGIWPFGLCAQETRTSLEEKVSPEPKPEEAQAEEAKLMEALWVATLQLTPPHRPRVGLVLGGGGARGLAHIGVLRVLRAQNFPLDLVVGTSVGAMIGSLYCAGLTPMKLSRLGAEVGWDDLSNLSPPALVRLFLTQKLLSSKKMEEYLNQHIGKKRFDELNTSFACIATDLRTGERILFREGDLNPAVRASATVPGLFEPVEYRHRLLVDGGLVSNAAVDVAKLMGAEFVVAVPVQADFSAYNFSSVFSTLSQSLYIQGRVLLEKELEQADVIIQPQVGSITTLELWRSKECIAAGTLAAEVSLPQMKRLFLERSFMKMLTHRLGASSATSENPS